MLPGTIVEFTNSAAKYYVKIKGWYHEVNGTVGGIDAAVWFVKKRTKKGWHRSESGYFPLRDCQEIKVCKNRSRLAMFLDV